MAWRPGRDQPAIADAEAAVKHPDGHAMRQIGVLHAVIHQDHVMRAALGNEARTARPVTRDKNIATIRQHQRLVPAGCGVMDGRIDPGRAAGTAAMTA